MEIKNSRSFKIVEKQNEYISELEREKQALLEQQRNMAIEYQKMFDMTQVQMLMVKLLGTDMKKIAEGDYSVHKIPAKEMKDIKRKVMEIIGKEI
ncbi:hypothetical protein FE415_02105 [Leuconostoc carnosum]|uniref:hypothetical protein n=1 Tax=Leuconostoc carnosum TaxID=1252 RepID=UPI0012385B58|nr:hypothetical protein [Leuconostoc carnosum]KAA8373144.1 hypothetical protein FE415_02105 [Leuconostoc carnosum]